MTPDVSDWFRSVTVLGIAFVTVIAVTSGLAIFIVPAPTVSSRASDAPSVDASGVAAPSVPGQVGGTITVSGARDEAFTLSREFTDGRYGLVGNEGRIYFDEDPLSVAQISFGGLEFILQPDDCVIEPGRRDDETGVADAHLRCESIEDVRGSGVVTLDGTIGIASDLLGLRGDLPPTGGTVAFGDRTVTFEEAEMLHPRITAFVGRLVDVEGVVALTLSYDGEARGLVINEVQTEGGLAEVAADACQLSTTEVGILNPHARLLELTIDCPSIDVPGIGLTTISGSLMVEEVEPQF
jgi:hypothetical protein